MSDAWDGEPPNTARDGWHWLRDNEGRYRLAWWGRNLGWRVADGIGRTNAVREHRIAALYTYREPVLPPDQRQENRDVR